MHINYVLKVQLYKIIYIYKACLDTCNKYFYTPKKNSKCYVLSKYPHELIGFDVILHLWESELLKTGVSYLYVNNI